MAKRKPRFKVGQVVAVRSSGRVFAIAGYQLTDSHSHTWFYWGMSGEPVAQKQLRPLTRREIGASRPARKGRASS